MRTTLRFALLTAFLATVFPSASAASQGSSTGTVRIVPQRGGNTYYASETTVGYFAKDDPVERFFQADGMHPGTIEGPPGTHFRVVQVIANDLNLPTFGTQCILTSTNDRTGFDIPPVGDTIDVTVAVDYKYCEYRIVPGLEASPHDTLVGATVHFHGDNSWVSAFASNGEPIFVAGGAIEVPCTYVPAHGGDCDFGAGNQGLAYGVGFSISYRPDQHTRIVGVNPLTGNPINGAPGQEIIISGTANRTVDFESVHLAYAEAVSNTEGSIALTANSVADTVATATFQVHNAGPDAGLFVIQATGTTVVRAGSGQVAKTEITTPAGTCVQSSGPCAGVALASGASASISVKTTTARLGDGSSAAVGANTCATVTIQSSGSDSHAADNSAPCSSGSAPVVTVATGGSPPASQTVAMGSTNVPVIQFAINPGAATTLDAITLTASGSGNDHVDITAVKLYVDVNANGVVDGSETALASGTFPSNNGSVTLTVSPAYAFSSAKTFLVTYDFNTTLASRYGGAIVLAGLLPVFLVPRKRRRGAAGLLLLLGVFAITSIGLGACGGDSTGPNPPPGASVTFSAQLTGLTAAGTPVSGVSVQGATLTIAK